VKFCNNCIHHKMCMGFDNCKYYEEERPHGEWIDEPIYKQTMDVKTWDGYTYCSECKQMHEYGHKSNFCPNCGSDNRKEGDEH